jgi:Holliday junction resolvase
MSRYARRKDENQNEIVDALEMAGCAVTDLSRAGDGVTDLLVTRAGKHYLIEVKSRRGKLRASQDEFRVKHDPVYLVRSVDQALKTVGLR